MARCPSCDKDMTAPPPRRCANPGHADTFSMAEDNRYAALMSTRVEAANDFDELKSLLVEYLRERGE